jgi:superfamily II DNA or RNA helicase
MTLHLRDYQEQALAAEFRHRQEHPEETRLAIVMATGLGKTIVAAEKACRHLDREGSRVLILGHTDEIVSQMEAKVRVVVRSHPDAAYSVGVVKADRNEVDADIICGSVQTLAQPGRREQIKNVGLVIVDECHHATADSYQAIMHHFGCFYKVHRDQRSVTPALGFTATLERGDGASLGGIWQNVAFSRDISWGVRKGYLVQPVGYRLEIDVSKQPLQRLSWNVDIADQQLVDSLAPEKIVEKWIELAANLCEECRNALDHVEPKCMPSYCPNAGCGVNAGVRPTVAFMPLVRSAVKLAEAFSAAGILAAVIDGEMPTAERRWKLAAYDRGDLQVLVNAMVLTEGWDSPRTKCVIVGRPTKSRPLFVQMAGRGLRPVPGVPVEEQECILLCVADSTTDLCTVADLSDKPIDRRTQGALTVMEDQWDIGAGLADPEHVWSGHVNTVDFDPLVRRSSKVWRTTKESGTAYLPISKEGGYVFIVGTSVFARSQDGYRWRTIRLHKDLPDLEMAMAVAEDEAQERGGDLGRLLADRDRPWRKSIPSGDMVGRAQILGLGKEVVKILESKQGSKAGRLSDLIGRVEATRALEGLVRQIKEKTSAEATPLL